MDQQQVLADEFKPVPASAVPTFSIPTNTNKSTTKSNKKKNKGVTGSLPLLRPPPPEKLRKWEEEKARPFQFLRGKGKKGKEQEGKDGGENGSGRTTTTESATTQI